MHGVMYIIWSSPLVLSKLLVLMTLINLGNSATTRKWILLKMHPSIVPGLYLKYVRSNVGTGLISVYIYIV
jgi:hypothetical protein